MIQITRKQRLFLRKIKKLLLKISPVFLLVVLVIGLFYVIFIRYVYERDLKDLLLDAQQSKNEQITKLEEEKKKKDQDLEKLNIQIEELRKQVLLPLPVRLVKKYFKHDAVTMLAIVKAESGLKANAKGYNCMYEGKSMACKPGDEQNAWSVDCGLAQNNFKGLVCPAYAMDPEWSIKEAKRKHATRGFQPWSVYNSGKYAGNLAWAKGQI